MAADKIMKFADGPAPIKEGQTVFITNGQGGSHFRGHEVLITKVGRELVTTEYRNQFYMETGYEKTQYTSGQMFSSKAAYEKHKEKNIFISSVESRLRNYKLTFEQAQQIAAILGEEKK